MKPGDHVTWVFTPGGQSSKPVLIEAVILKTTSPERVKIEFSYLFKGECRFGSRTVLLATLLPRTLAGPQQANILLGEK